MAADGEDLKTLKALLRLQQEIYAILQRVFIVVTYMTLHNCRRTYKSLKVRVNNSKIEKENEASDSLIREEESFEFVTRLKILPRDMVFG